MKSRRIAIAGTLAALSVAALPVAGAAAATTHARPNVELKTRDAHHVDRSRDRSIRDSSRDLHDR